MLYSFKSIMLSFMAFFSSFFMHQDKISFDCNNVKIMAVRGDITQQHDVDAIVNAANRRLLHGGGVCGVIFQKAGDELQNGCEKALLAFKDRQVPVSGAVITDGYKLSTKIIHVVSPNFNPRNAMQESILFDDMGKKLLETSYDNLLEVAHNNGIERVAIPFLSGGNFCRLLSDKSELANIAISAVVNFCNKKTKNNLKNNLKEIRFVLYDKKDFDLFAREVDTYSKK